MEKLDITDELKYIQKVKELNSGKVLKYYIMTMPGLPRVPSAENIDLDENGNIIGIF